MARPSHFEIPVDDPDRAEKFYQDVFDWKFNRFEGAPSYYGLADTGWGIPGINGALSQRSDENNAVTITMSVDSIEDGIAKVIAAGGSVVQDKAPVPGMGYFAVCRDTEGNKVGLFVNDESATM